MVEMAPYIVISLAVAWLLQYGLAFLQLKRFYKRLYQLRRFGSVWVGKYGSAWKGRTFAILVVTKDRHISRVEQFSGWTVLANLKPIEGLEGRPIADLTNDSIQLPVSHKLLLALRSAVSFIEIADQQSAERAKEAENASLPKEGIGEFVNGDEANRHLSLESES